METNLKASLKSLQADLAATGPVDEELQELLLQLEDDIKQLLENRADAEAEPDTITYGLAERTQEISAKFAVKHPQLEPALRELGRILNGMGI